jgi:pimeloyl-ACP methyl ester carboxylesterase
MSPTVEAAGVELAYRERGDGEAVLLVHGMADDAAGWDELVDRLAGRARVIAYDRRGYGASGAPDPYERTTVQEQAEDAAALLRALDAIPALLCGRDIGTLACLDLIKRHRPLVRAAVLIDPPLYALAPAATEALAEERLRLEEALRAGGPQAAVSEFVGGARGGDARLARATAVPAAFFADYGGLASWPVSRRELRGLDVALAVLTTPEARPHVLQAADALAELVPGARRAHAEPALAALEGLLV